MNSDFLNDVMAYRYLAVKNRVGNHVICCWESDGQDMVFLATDDHDWHGTLMVQYQGEIDSHEAWGKAHDFLDSLSPVPALTRFECHEATHEIRLVMRCPLHEAYFGYDDVKQMIPTFCDLWKTVEPLIDRAVAGEDVRVLIAEAHLGEKA